MTTTVERAGAVLSVDLDALAWNYRQLRRRLGRSACAAVVKADGYGLGASRVATTLLGEGCRAFFVAHIEEGIGLRRALGPDPAIFVLNGTPPGTAPDFVAFGLFPVINSMSELVEWRRLASSASRALPVALQVDSGMSRLGISTREARSLADDTMLLQGLRLCLLMSHLACADEPGHSANSAQAREFGRIRASFPNVPASLANSSGRAVSSLSASTQSG